ncbi:MAG TPA: 4-(cytidine 5'-diphospho)-2-C-methyl-D-erythritol kinase [Casimicrobiaceae bacterium]|nr:4-(cytidine 5'-diphospho)-2-C-methyl-D-erythritol kinase [Casimicrobiaceae bacterium]
MTAARLDVPAPAKVNLFLHVTGRRDDGYHLIESLFALIDLADDVTLVARDDGAVVRGGDVEGVPADVDLALRAARALRQASGTSQGATISVRKRIPLGGGLGGGSSDAASVLLGLDRLWNLRMPRTELARIGLALGADVPFFVHGENAVVRGIGEIVRPVSLPRQWLALAMPPVAVPTAAIFAAPELTRSTPSAKIDVFSEGYGRNDLEAVAASRFPAVARAIEAFKAVARDARMTGSGACAIAACESEERAREAVAALPAGIAGRVVRTLDRHPLAR